MTPLAGARPGDPGFVKRVGGKAETRQFLENLGFVPGTRVTVVTEISGNVIVSVREARVAISREMAAKILI